MRVDTAASTSDGGTHRPSCPPPADPVQWRAPCEEITSCAISPRGDRVVAGSRDGNVHLFDHRGKELWVYSAHQRVSQTTCSPGSRLYLAGTWGGYVGAYIDEGYEWDLRLDGVTSALATTLDGSVVAVGTWAGRLHVCRADRTPVGAAALDDAVTLLAIDGTGDLILTGLANGTVVGMSGSGDERWRCATSARLRCLSVCAEGALAVCDDAVSIIDHRGNVVRRETIGNGVSHVAISADGTLVACVDKTNRLLLFRPGQERPYLLPQLPAAPDALAVVGRGDTVACIAVLSTLEIIAYDRRMKPLRPTQRLPARVSAMSLSTSGVHACCVSDGALLFLEIAAMKAWSAKPNVVCRVAPGSSTSFVENHVAPLRLLLTNDGGGHAYDVTVRIEAQDYIRKPQEAVIAGLGPDQVQEVRLPIDPTRLGTLPIVVSLTFRDRLADEPEQRTHRVEIEVERDEGTGGKNRG